MGFSAADVVAGSSVILSIFLFSAFAAAANFAAACLPVFFLPLIFLHLLWYTAIFPTFHKNLSQCIAVSVLLQTVMASMRRCDGNVHLAGDSESSDAAPSTGENIVRQHGGNFKCAEKHSFQCSSMKNNV